MPIETIYHDSFDYPIFHVLEQIEVYDGSSAIGFDHLLNHIKVLHTLANGVAIKDVIAILSQHPHYGIAEDEWKYENLDKLVRILENECSILVQYVSLLSPMDNKEQKQQRIITEMRERVPFLDYRYPNDSFLSAADREN